MHKRKRWLAAVGVSLVVWPVVLSGCNGDGIGGPVPNPTATAVGSALAGTYSGTFSGGASGTLSLVVGADGTLRGTLDSGSLRAALNKTSSAAPPITRALITTATGLLNPNGDFSITFVVGSQSVTFRGRLVRVGSGVVAQSLTWSSTGGQSGVFTLQAAGPAPTATPGTTGTPATTGTAAPTASATAAPTPTGGGACTNGTGNATFSAVTAPIVSAAFESACANGALSFVGERPVQIVVALGDSKSGKVRALAFAGNDFLGGVATGKTFTVSPTNLATYTETEPGTNRITQWIATGGTFTVDQLQGTSAEVRFNNVRFGPGRGVGNITAGTGNFTVTGSASLRGLRRQ